MKNNIFLFILVLFTTFNSCAKETNSDVNDQQTSDLAGYAIIDSVICEGRYSDHLQGITKGDNSMFWCFTRKLVKTDLKGKVVAEVEVPNHHGDLTFHNGKVYVAVGFGTWNNINGLAESWVYEYDAGTLALTNTKRVPELIYGAGGMIYLNNKFYVVGGLPPEIHENYIYEYDNNFTFQKRHTVETGYTQLGIQTIDYHDGLFWLGCYGSAKLIQLNADFEVVSKKNFDASLGLFSQSNSEIWVATNQGSSANGYRAKAYLYKK